MPRSLRAFKGFDILFIDGNGVVHLRFTLTIGHAANVHGSDFHAALGDALDVGRIGKQKHHAFTGVFRV